MQIIIWEDHNVQHSSLMWASHSSISSLGISVSRLSHNAMPQMLSDAADIHTQLDADLCALLAAVSITRVSEYVDVRSKLRFISKSHRSCYCLPAGFNQSTRN